jgi:hypothetical protein
MVMVIDLKDAALFTKKSGSQCLVFAPTKANTAGKVKFTIKITLSDKNNSPKSTVYSLVVNIE